MCFIGTTQIALILLYIKSTLVASPVVILQLALSPLFAYYAELCKSANVSKTGINLSMYSST